MNIRRYKESVICNTVYTFFFADTKKKSTECDYLCIAFANPIF